MLSSHVIGDFSQSSFVTGFSWSSKTSVRQPLLFCAPSPARSSDLWLLLWATTASTIFHFPLPSALLAVLKVSHISASFFWLCISELPQPVILRISDMLTWLHHFILKVVRQRQLAFYFCILSYLPYFSVEYCTGDCLSWRWAGSLQVALFWLVVWCLTLLKGKVPDSLPISDCVHMKRCKIFLFMKWQR